MRTTGHASRRTADVRCPLVTVGATRQTGPMLDHETCYRAVSGRDPRFDGWFVTAVTTTGIYCRPSCPATTPKRRNVTFFPTAAAAQLAGFRACRRCRPDASPGSPEWNVRSDTVARAMRLIGDGAVDREGVAGLAARLGYSERQLHRLLVAEVGAGAQALARAQRAHTARILVETTDLRLVRGGVRGRVRQHPPVQRHGPRGLRHHAPRPAGEGHRPRQRRSPRDDGAAAGHSGRRSTGGGCSTCSRPSPSPASRRTTGRRSAARSCSRTARPPST